MPDIFYECQECENRVWPEELSCDGQEAYCPFCGGVDLHECDVEPEGLDAASREEINLK